MESFANESYQMLTVENKIFIYKLLLETKSACCTSVKYREFSNKSNNIAWKLINERLKKLFAGSAGLGQYETFFWVKYAVRVNVKTSTQSIREMFDLFKPPNVEFCRIAKALDVSVTMFIHCSWLYDDAQDGSPHGVIEFPHQKNYTIHLLNRSRIHLITSFAKFEQRLTEIYYKHRYSALPLMNCCQGVSYFTLVNLIDHSSLDAMIKYMIENFSGQGVVDDDCKRFITTVLVAYWVVFLLMETYKLRFSETLDAIEQQDQYPETYYYDCTK